MIGYSLNNESLTSNFMVVKGNEYLKEKFLGKVFFYHSQGFFQNNSFVAEKMINYVKSKLNSKKDHLLDLYGGVGVFGLSAHEFFDKVTIIESFPLSVKYAKENIKFSRNGYKINSVALFDMFPQTNHIEAVIEMERN